MPDSLTRGERIAVHGKKGRLAVHVRLLARLAAVESAIEACLCETTTWGSDGMRWAV